MERNIVYEFVNQDPERYRKGRVVGLCREIGGSKCTISRDMKGKLVVSCWGEVFEFAWDSQANRWS